jgi:hypothetical protein
MACALFWIVGKQSTYDSIDLAVRHVSYYPNGERIGERLIDTSLNPPWLPRLFELDHPLLYIAIGAMAWVLGIVAGCVLLLWAVRRAMHLNVNARRLLPIGIRCVDRTLRIGWWLPAATFATWIVFERSLAQERIAAKPGVPVAMIGINDQPTFIVMMAGGMMLMHCLVLYHSLPCVMRASKEFRRSSRDRCVGCGYDLGSSEGSRAAVMRTCSECGRATRRRLAGSVEPCRWLLRHQGTWRRVAVIAGAWMIAVVLLTAPRSGTIAYEAAPGFVRANCGAWLSNMVYASDRVLVRILGPERFCVP